MKVTAERIPEARLVLQVEVDDEQVRKALDQAARTLAQRYRIPGFRKGRAPRAIVERTLGADAVFEAAVEKLVPAAYEDAVKDQDVEPYDAPDLEIVTRAPFKFKATVPLMPTVDLGDYHAIAVAPPQVAITDEMVDRTILELRRRHAILEPVDRPAALDDRIKGDLRATVGDAAILDEKDAQFFLRAGQEIGVPGVTEEIVGLAVGVEKSFAVPVAEAWPDPAVAGQTVHFTVTLHEIMKEILPEPDDDLASEVGEFESFAALRQRVVDDLRQGAEARAREGFQAAIVDALVARATVEYPPRMRDHEVDHMLQDLAREAGPNLEAYLRRRGQSLPALRRDLAPQATARILRTLVLSQVADLEKIAVTDADLDAEVVRIAGDGPQADQVRSLFDNANGRTVLRRNLLTTRTLDRLAEIATANAAAAAESAAAAAPEAAQATEPAPTLGESPTGSPDNLPPATSGAPDPDPTH